MTNNELADQTKGQENCAFIGKCFKKSGALLQWFVKDIIPKKPQYNTKEN